MFDQAAKAYRVAVYQLTEQYMGAVRQQDVREIEAFVEDVKTLVELINDSLIEDRLPPSDVEALSEIREMLEGDSFAVSDVRLEADKLEGVERGKK